VSFSIGSPCYEIGGVYISPLSPINIYESHKNSVAFLINQFTNHTFIICGDYNLPENLADNGLLYYLSLTTVLLNPEMFVTYSFSQVNNTFNAHGSL